MSSPKYASPLILEIKPSRRLRVFSLVVLAASLLVVLLIPLDWYFRLGLVICIAVFGGRELRRLGEQSRPDRIVRIVWDDEGAWWLHQADGQQIEAQLLGDTLVQPFAVILQLRRLQDRRRFSWVLLDDNCNAQTLRRLRVRLKHGADR